MAATLLTYSTKSKIQNISELRNFKLFQLLKFAQNNNNNLRTSSLQFTNYLRKERFCNTKKDNTDVDILTEVYIFLLV